MSVGAGGGGKGNGVETRVEGDWEEREVAERGKDKRVDNADYENDDVESESDTCIEYYEQHVVEGAGVV